jgi:acyl-CoA synthetase (AMP-forming)/AMP-acid ligase II
MDQLPRRRGGSHGPAGEIGEVVARAPGMMHSIWGDPEATAARILPGGWIRTRDMGRISPDGFLYLTARKDDTIISGGINIWPIELETALAAWRSPRRASSACRTRSGARRRTPWWCCAPKRR